MYVKRLAQSHFIRFLCSGGLNTLATYGLYLLLLQWLSYRESYTIAYVTGIVLAYLLNRLFVFRSHKGLKSVAMMPLIYSLQYVLNLFILWVWVDYSGLDKKIGPLIVIFITVPITYFLMKLSFSHNEEQP